MKKKKVETKRNKRQCPQTNTSIVLGGLILVISLTLYTCTSSKTLKNQFYRESSCECRAPYWYSNSAGLPVYLSDTLYDIVC